MTFSCIARTTQGGSVTFNKVISFTFESDYFDVSDHLTVKLPNSQAVGIFTTLDAYIDGRCFFRGMVDLQQNIFSREGNWLQLECTSIHARLKQNQVQPTELNNFNTAFIIQNYIQPYGITSVEMPDASCSYMSITLGMTAWDVVDLYCRMIFDHIPHFNRDGALSSNPISGYTVYLGGVSGATPYLSLRYCDNTKSVLSSVHAKASDDKYDYSYVVTNPLAATYQIQRERYYKPLECWDYIPGMGVEEVIRNSNAKSKVFDVEVPKILDVYPSDKIVFLDRPDFPSPLYAGHVKWQADENGCFTTIQVYDGNRI